MENEYTQAIWDIVALKSNQHLSPFEMQDKIKEQLSFFKTEVQSEMERKIKNHYTKKITETLEQL